MAKKQASCGFRTSIGGQALIEGILMRGPEKQAIVVRSKDGLVTKVEELKLIGDRYPILKLPILRGAVTFISSMVNGVKALMFSADYFPDEDLAQPGKLDLWLEKHVPAEKLQNVIVWVSVLLSLALSLGLFMLLPTFLAGLVDPWLHSAAVHNLIEGVVKIAIFMGYMILISRQKDVARVFQYHGAEHKTIFCYEHGRELTVDNVRPESRFHPRCGTSFIFIIIIINIIISSVVALIFPILQDHSMRLVWMVVKIFGILPIVTAISYEMLKYAGRHTNIVTKVFSAPGLWMQRITTAEPTDDMIEVGIASLKGALYGVEREAEKPETPEPETEPAAEEKPAAENE
jgi:uncharacterized protein YqhQ